MNIEMKLKARDLGVSLDLFASSSGKYVGLGDCLFTVSVILSLVEAPSS